MAYGKKEDQDDKAPHNEKELKSRARHRGKQNPVSYTHLDVYKRQSYYCVRSSSYY